jgi:2-haloacid dehalogenase
VKYKWLLFDADGTLFDYDKAEALALRSTFQALGWAYEARYAQVYRRINGEIWLDFENGKISQERLRTRRFELLFDAIGIECDPGEFSGRYLANLALGTYLIEGAEDVVKSLHGRVGLLLITNGLAEVQRPRFARSSVGQYFSVVVISEEVGAAKPDTAIFEVAFAKMDFPKKEDVLIVGDSLTSDIKGGHNYGIDTCWFNPERKASDSDVVARYEIGELEELLLLLESA